MYKTTHHKTFFDNYYISFQKNKNLKIFINNNVIENIDVSKYSFLFVYLYVNQTQYHKYKI